MQTFPLPRAFSGTRGDSVFDWRNSAPRFLYPPLCLSLSATFGTQAAIFGNESSTSGALPSTCVTLSSTYGGESTTCGSLSSTLGSQPSTCVGQSAFCVTLTSTCGGVSPTFGVISLIHIAQSSFLCALLATCGTQSVIRGAQSSIRVAQPATWGYGLHTGEVVSNGQRKTLGPLVFQRCRGLYARASRGS